MAVQLIKNDPATLNEYRDSLFFKYSRIEDDFKAMIDMYDCEGDFLETSEAWQAKYAFFNDLLGIVTEYREKALQGLYSTYEEKRINSELKEIEERMCG